MAGISAAGGWWRGADKNKAPEDQNNLTFSELMQILYGCAPGDLFFTIPPYCPNGLEWLNKYQKDANSPPVQGKKSLLTAHLMLPSHPIHKINLDRTGVYYDMKQAKDAKDKVFAAFSMAVLAKGHPDIRKKGAWISGDQEEMALLYIATHFAGIAVHKKQAKTLAPQAGQMADSLQKNHGLDVKALWEEFCKNMQDFNPQMQPTPTNANSPPPPSPSPVPGNNPQQNQPPPSDSGEGQQDTGLDDNGMAKELNQALRDKLQPSNTRNLTNKDLQTYWDAWDAPVQQDFLKKHGLDHLEGDYIKKFVGAKEPPPVPTAEPEEPSTQEPPESLSTIFNRTIPDEIRTHLATRKVSPELYQKIREEIVKGQDVRRKVLAQKYKDAFNLTHNQLDNIVEALDKEGVTTLQNGNRRVINYNSEGQPKDVTPS